MSISFVAGSPATGTASSLVITKPAGVVDGDVMYMLSLQDAGSGASLAGWTALGAVTNTPSNGFPTTLLRRVASGEGATYTFAMTGGSISEGVIWAYRGVDNVTPEDVAVTIGTGTAATITYPSVTSVTNNAVHLALCENFNALASQPTGYTQRTTGAAWTTDSDLVYASAGTVSGITSTGGGDWVARSIMLRPAAGGTDILLGQAIL